MDGLTKPATVLIRLAVTLSIALVAGVAFAWPRLSDALVYQRADILAGQAWRLWTGHLVHFSLSHLLLDLLVFVAAGAWLELIEPRMTRWFYLLAPPAISLALLWGDPTLRFYAGLSGVGTGLLVLLAMIQWGRDTSGPAWFWPAVLLLVVVKVAVELLSRQPLFARFEPGIRVVPLAHISGIACAMVAYVVMRRRAGRAAA